MSPGSDMKVLFITLSSAKIGKANIDIYYNASNLAERGYQLHIVTRQGDRTLIQDERQDGLYLHPLPLIKTPFAALMFFPVFFIQVILLMRKINPDIVIAENNLHCPIVGFWGAKLFNKPHGVILRELTADAIFHDSTQWFFKRWMAWIMMKMDHAVISKIEHKIAINQGIAMYYKSVLGQEILSNWMIGYPFDRFKVSRDTLHEVKERFHMNDEGRYLLYTGSLQSERGLEAVMRVLSKLGDDNPYHLLITGEGRAEEELKQLANNLGLAGRVQFLGWLPDRELYALIKLASFGLEPYSRPWPQDHTPSTKVALYVAGGLFVICTPAVGYEEIVKKDLNGYYYKDEEELTALLQKLKGSNSIKSRENIKKVREIVNVNRTSDAMEYFLRDVFGS